MTRDEITEAVDAAVGKALSRTLESFGIEEADKKELRADFLHLRKWRVATEQAQSYTVRAIITAIVAGLLGALWLGAKTFLGK